MEKSTDLQNRTADNTQPQIWGWICFIVGSLALSGALSWLMISLVFIPTLEILVPGVVQLFIAIVLIASKWLVSHSKLKTVLIVAILCLLTNTAFACWFFVDSVINSASTNKNDVLTVRDPDSPMVVSIDDSRGLLDDKPSWSGTISADGKRPTQYTGWPVHLIGNVAAPVKLIWHNDDPDWVEIKMDNGYSLKLTWDPKAAFDARLIRDKHYFLDPQFELLPKTRD